MDQHRAAIGGFSARQLSHGWKLSSNRNSVPLKRTERNRRTRSHAVRTTTILVTERILLVITLSLMTMACPLVQQVFEHAFRDCRSFQKDGAEGEGSKAVCLEPCLGRQEPLHQLTERGTPSLFSDNFNLTTMIQKLDGSMETKPTLWVSLQNQKFLSVVHSQEDLISA